MPLPAITLSAGAAHGRIEYFFEGPKQMGVGKKLIDFFQFFVEAVKRRIDKAVAEAELLG